jgi:DNA-directed RNA polymerase specialized sigma24 family protein
VRRALAQLSLSDQQIIYLAHQNDLSCAEIAVALNKPSISAVTSHLHRAMCHLKEKLMQSDWFEDMADGSANVPSPSPVRRNKASA